MTETKKSNACVLEPTGYDLPANIATTNPRRYAPSRAVIVECYSDELRCRRLFALCDAIEPDCSEVRARNRSGNGPPSRYALRRDNLACIMSEGCLVLGSWSPRRLTGLRLHAFVSGRRRSRWSVIEEHLYQRRTLGCEAHRQGALNLFHREWCVTEHQDAAVRTALAAILVTLAKLRLYVCEAAFGALQVQAIGSLRDVSFPLASAARNCDTRGVGSVLFGERLYEREIHLDLLLLDARTQPAIGHQCQLRHCTALLRGCTVHQLRRWPRASYKKADVPSTIHNSPLPLPKNPSVSGKPPRHVCSNVM